MSSAEPDVFSLPGTQKNKHHVSLVLWLNFKYKGLRKLEWTHRIGLVSMNVFNAIQIVYRPDCLLFHRMENKNRITKEWHMV